MAITGGSRTLKLSILADVDQLKKSLNAGSNDVQGFGAKITKFGKIAAAAFVAAGVAATAMAGKFAIDAVKAASDLSETVSKVGVLFGDSANEIEAFASTAAQAFGQTKQQALDASATFAIFGSSAGLAGSDLVKFSTDFTGLASDLASFNNTSPEDAINAIGSALRGEAEPLRRYGVLLNDATLKAAATTLGIYAGTGALTAQQKVLAAQQVIYEQTGSAQGDFARTSDGLANKQRIVAAEIENVKVSIGEKLLPIALELFSFFNDKLVPALQNIAAVINTNLSPIIENLSGFIQDNVIPVFSTWWGFISETVIPGIVNFFKPILNGLFKAFKTIADSIRENSDELKPLFDLFKAVASFVAKVLAPVIGTVLGAAFQVLAKAASVVLNVFSGIVSVISRIISLMASPVLKAVSGITGAIGNIFGGGKAAGGSVSAGTSYLVGERGPELFTPSGSGRIIPNGGGGNTINIVVNGALDSEGAARAIVQALNNSFYRGTGGAGALAT